jgi:hypothetical protein
MDAHICHMVPPPIRKMASSARKLGTVKHGFTAKKMKNKRNIPKYFPLKRKKQTSEALRESSIYEIKPIQYETFQRPHEETYR